jgi:glycosyltransferase involved in cell wall biosynthesis
MSYSKISVLIPTRNRIEYLKKMLKSYEDTVANPDQTELVFRVDSDDPQSADFLAHYGWPIIVGPRDEGYKSLPRFYNEMVKQAAGDLFVCGNDDMIFLTPDWPRLVIEEANKYPDGIFNIGVSTGLNDEKFPFSIVSRQLVDRLGKINDERLLFSDIFLLDIARHFNRAILLHSVIFYHDWTGYTNDQTRRDASKHEFSEVWEKAPGNWTAAYTKLHNMAVSEAIAKLDSVSKIRINQ